MHRYCDCVWQGKGEVMERRVEITGYWIIGTNMIFWLGIIFLEPAFLVRMLSLCIWLSLECYLTSKFLFDCRKMKLQEAGNEKKYHSIEYIFSEEINPKIRKYFSASELLQAEIAENRANTYILCIPIAKRK